MSLYSVLWRLHLVRRAWNYLYEQKMDVATAYTYKNLLLYTQKPVCKYRGVKK